MPVDLAHKIYLCLSINEISLDVWHQKNAAHILPFTRYFVVVYSSQEED